MADSSESRYHDYPDHPLASTPIAVLEVARGVMQRAVECGDVDSEVADPLADAVVAALIEAGYVVMPNVQVDVATRGLMWLHEIAAECGPAAGGDRG